VAQEYKNKKMEENLKKLVGKQKERLEKIMKSGKKHAGNSSKSKAKIEQIIDDMAKDFSKEMKIVEKTALEAVEPEKYEGDKILNWEKNIQSQFAWQILFVFGGMIFF